MNKTAINKLLVAERKSMREKQRQSEFLRKTLNIYNGLVKRCGVLTFGIDNFRDWIQSKLPNGCHYCGCRVTVKSFTVDHYEPVSRGGTTLKSNLCIACKPCNFQKGGLDGDSFERLLSLLREYLPDWAQADVKRRLTIGGRWAKAYGAPSFA